VLLAEHVVELVQQDQDLELFRGQRRNEELAFSFDLAVGARVEEVLVDGDRPRIGIELGGHRSVLRLRTRGAEGAHDLAVDLQVPEQRSRIHAGGGSWSGNGWSATNPAPRSLRCP
jgi:hypothetical protein